MSPTSGDLLLVNRGGVNYQIDYDDMSTLQDTDLLLVNRAGVNYQIAASDLDLGPDGLILPPVEVLTPVNGAGLNEGNPYTPISSAYVSTDSTPIYYRYFPIAITTVSGGAWVDENNIFDGSTSTYATLGGAAGVVSKATYTNLTSFSLSGETTVYAYAAGGGTIEVIDENDAVLRTYTLPSTASSTAIGIVRADNQIRFTTAVVNTSLLIGEVQINGSDKVDYVISGRVAFEFTDSTDLDKMVAPIIMTDENGDVKVPTTSTVDSTTTITGEDKGWDYTFVGSSSDLTINSANYGLEPTGDRMLWLKIADARSGVIASKELNGLYLTTAEPQGPSGMSTSIQLNDGSTTYLEGSSDTHKNNYKSYVAEIGVAPKVLDIVTWTGDGTSLREIPHNLGCKPGMIIAKRSDGLANWAVWHKDLGRGYKLILNASNGKTSDGDVFTQEPTQDEFYVGSGSETNAPGDEYVAYVFAADTAGKVKCGTYTGRGYILSLIHI